MQLENYGTTSLSYPTFETILRPDTNVVRLPRTLGASMKMRLQTLAQQSKFRHTARLDANDPEVSGLLTSIPEGPEREFLATDIRSLAQKFGALLGRRHLHAGLTIQRTDACRKIHVDYVSIRLICTYAGPGTDWLPNSALVREHLGRTDVDVHSANRSVIREGATLRRCGAGDVILLKGEAYPGNTGRGAAHRSPPIEGSGVARIVLKFDEHPCGC